MKVPSGLRIDSPSWPLLQAHVSYWGVTTAAGAATGLNFICAGLITEPSYVGLQVKMISGPAAGQVRTILINAAGTETVDDAFRDNTGAAVTIAAGTLFVILSQSSGGGGPIPPTGPSQGLSFMGDVTNAISAVSFASTDLAGFPTNSFINTYLIYVFRDAAGAAPQGEYRLVTGYTAASGTFVHGAFSANLAVGDKVLLVHISILFPNIVASGALTASSTVQPADGLRAEGNQWFRGCTLMMLTGPVAFQTRAIVYYTNPGIFTLDTQNPLTALPVVGSRYIVLGSDFPTAPGTDATPTLTPGDVIGNKTDTATAVADNFSSVIRYLKGILPGAVGVTGKPNIQEVIIYPVAEDAGVTEIADDGASPAYYPAVAASTVVVGEGNAVAAWSEDIDFEQAGTITIISIYAHLEWQSRFLVNGSDGTNSGSKVQISRDGGANFVDVTDNYIHNNAVMTARTREGVGQWIGTIVAGANQLVLRLVHWVNVGSGVSASEAQMRSSSYLRITYRKS